MKITEDDLRRIVDREVSNASIWQRNVLSDEQDRNLRYYLGMPLGNEVDGRSKYTSWDVFEVVEGAVTELIEPFFSGENIGKFEPAGIGDEDFAEQATDYINYKITKHAGAFVKFTSWIKDGLISKIGVMRVWWDATKQKIRRNYAGLSIEQIAMMQQDPSIEIIEQEQVGEAFNVSVVVDKGPKGLCYTNTPPENFIISRGAKFDDDGPVIGEICTYTASDLVEMGFKRQVVDELSDYDVSGSVFDEQEIRDGTFLGDRMDRGEGANREIRLFSGFVKADMDDDGIVEWRRVLMGGNTILENEAVEDHEYCIWTPIPLPHRVVGMSFADVTAPIQDSGTALGRQYLDSLYLANNPRSFAVEDQVNLADMLNTRIGGIVRMKAPGMAGPLQTSVVARDALEGIEWNKTQREQRVGVTRFHQGLDDDALNKTATAASLRYDNSQKRMLMTLRTFAEVGVKALYRKALKISVEYQDKEEMIRLRDSFVPFQPSKWNPEMDVTIEVGIGSGDKDRLLMRLQLVGNALKEAAMAGLPAVQGENLYQLLKMIVSAANIKNGDRLLLTDPKNVPPQPPKPTPDELKIQAQMQLEGAKAQADVQKFQAQATIDSQSKQMEIDAELQKTREEIASRERIEAAKIEADKEAKLLELAAGVLAAQHGGPATNLTNGTTLDTSAQKAQLGPQDLAKAIQSIRSLSEAVGGPVDPFEVENALLNVANPPPPEPEEDTEKVAIMQMLQNMNDTLRMLAQPKEHEIMRDANGKALGVKQVVRTIQ